MGKDIGGRGGQVASRKKPPSPFPLRSSQPSLQIPKFYQPPLPSPPFPLLPSTPSPSPLPLLRPTPTYPSTVQSHPGSAQTQRPQKRAASPPAAPHVAPHSAAARQQPGRCFYPYSGVSAAQLWHLRGARGRGGVGGAGCGGAGGVGGAGMSAAQPWHLVVVVWGRRALGLGGEAGGWRLSRLSMTVDPDPHRVQCAHCTWSRSYIRSGSAVVCPIQSVSDAG